MIILNKQSDLTTIIFASLGLLIYASIGYDFLVIDFALPKLQQKSGCPSSSFACQDGSCIPISWVCDGEYDCHDKSDETQETCQLNSVYSTKRCSNLEFMCEKGCLDVHKVCDSKADCANGRDEDEDLCKNFSCDHNEFACIQIPFRCIPKFWTCDGEKDCLDGTDEANCNKTCTAEQFQCDDGNCVDARYVCNSQPDCFDGSDEMNCTQHCDPSSQFECSPNHCIDKSQACDGVADCQQGQDEKNCTSPALINPSVVCLSTEKLCSNLIECVHMNWWCDGTPDCSDGSDESPKSCPNSTCPGKFRCDTGECVIAQLCCDGRSHCLDGSDELRFPSEHNPCSDHAQFHCGGGLCVAKTGVCDGRKDCPDGSDEPASCHRNECSQNNGNCSQICTDTPESFKCECHEGFRMDGGSCVDVNECSEFGACSQVCHNTIGSFVCSCIGGYISDPAELRKCKVAHDVPFLLVGYSNEIRQIRTNGEEPRFISLAHAPTCIDYSYDNSTVMWSEAHSKAVYLTYVNGTEAPKKVPFLSEQSIDSFALDWMEQNVYWTSTEKGALGVSTISTERHSVLFDDLMNPCCIIVDPSTKWMYWVHSVHYAKIERAGMDASARETLISQDIILVTALTLDFVQQRLYWVDSHLNKIFSVKTDGLGRQTILYSPFLKSPVSLAVFEDYVFWANKDHSKIFRTNKFTGNNVTFILHQNSTIPISYVVILHHYNQPLLSKICQSANHCSHICLPSPIINGSIQTHRCVCPGNKQNCTMDVYNISNDNRTHTTDKNEDYSRGYETLYAGIAVFVMVVLFSLAAFIYKRSFVDRKVLNKYNSVHEQKSIEKDSSVMFSNQESLLPLNSIVAT